MATPAPTTHTNSTSDAIGSRTAATWATMLGACGRAILTAAAEFSAIAEETITAPAPATKGPWQRRVLRLPGLSLEQGMTASEVAAAIGYDTANIYGVLENLDGEWLEIVERRDPR